MMKPEEIVRQLFAEKLMNEFGYPKEDIVFEHPVKSVGRDKENTDFIVPVLPEELQNEIASLVGQSLECKQQSRLLQQSAIQMVEEVIEKYRVN